MEHNFFATLPNVPTADGALAFDTSGAFGYALLAATGRSGGAVRRIGAEPTPGGADEIAVAPARFGAASGQALLAVDAGKSGSLVAMDSSGRARTLLTLPDGPNPLVVIAPGQAPAAGAATPGLYVTDTLSRDAYLAPAAELAPYVGDVVVGSELRGLFWAVAPHGSGFVGGVLVQQVLGAGQRVHSDLLGTDMQMIGRCLRLLDPRTGLPIPTPAEDAAARLAAEQRAQEAEAARHSAELRVRQLEAELAELRVRQLEAELAELRTRLARGAERPPPEEPA
jgi:hypothetical protein